MDNYGDIRVQSDQSSISAATDYDIENDDISLKNGDIDIVTDDESIQKSIYRKIKTYFGSYGALVSTYELDSLTQQYRSVVLNKGLAYGSDLTALLSEPFNFNTVKLIKSSIQSVVSSDSRINLIDVGLDLKNRIGLLSVVIKYQTVGSSEISSVSLNLNGIN